MSDKMTLRLYMAGITPENQKMILNFKELLTEELGDNYDLEIIDVLERPELAEEEKILATPTVVKVLSGRAQKMILDLEDRESLMVGMDLIKAD